MPRADPESADSLDAGTVVTPKARKKPTALKLVVGFFVLNMSVRRSTGASELNQFFAYLIDKSCKVDLQEYWVSFVSSPYCT